MGRLFDDAASDKMRSGSAAVSSQPFTLCGWFNFDTLALALQCPFVVGTTGSSDHQWRTIVNNTPRLVFRARSTSAGSATGTGIPVINVWQHYAGVEINAASRDVLLNAAGKGSNTSSITPSGMDETLLGATSGVAYGSFISGLLADWALWNVALSDTEIAALARGTHPLKIRTVNLTNFWQLYGLGSPEPDYSRGQKSMTLTGTAVGAHVYTSLPYET